MRPDGSGKKSFEDSEPEQSISDEDYLRELEQYEKDFKELESRVDRILAPRLKELAGPHFDEMLKSQDETLRRLSDPNSNVREAALQIAYQKWELTDALAPVYEEMALSDPSDGVRNTAIRALGTCYRKSKNERIGYLLANVVKSEHVSEETRVTAFTALLRLHGNSDYLGTSPLVPQSLRDIDWVFVDSYSKEKE